MEIDSKTGIALAKKTGYARVKFLAGEESVFTRQILVSNTEGVELDSHLVLSSLEGVKAVGIVFGSGGKNLLTTQALEKEKVPSPVEVFKCEISWSLSADINEIFKAEATWLGDKWACAFHSIGSGPEHPVEITLKVFGAEKTIQYLPSIAVHHTNLEVGVEGGVVRVAGHSHVLDLLVTKHSEGVSLGSPWLNEGELHIPVSLTSHHYHSHPTVTVSVPPTGQSLTVNILPLVNSCKAPTGFMSAIIGDLLMYYQSVLSIIVAIVLAVYLTQSFLSKPAASNPTPSPAKSPPKQAEQNQEPAAAPGSPYLWTVDNSPIYGSPIFR